MIELEFRSRFSEEEYIRIKKFLDANAENLGQDDKDCAYFIFSDKLLKVVHNVSKKDAKISLKLNRIGQGASFEEHELHFKEKDFELAKTIFRKLNLPVKFSEESQTRINYQYKNCEIALKYGKTWGHHLEIEKVIEEQGQQPQAETEIKAVTDELGVRIMTDQELKDFIQDHESKL